MKDINVKHKYTTSTYTHYPTLFLHIPPRTIHTQSQPRPSALPWLKRISTVAAGDVPSAGRKKMRRKIPTSACIYSCSCPTDNTPFPTAPHSHQYHHYQTPHHCPQPPPPTPHPLFSPPVGFLCSQPAAYRALAVLAKAARKCVGTFRPQDVSMVALALARMSWDDPELMMGLTARTTETLRAFK